MAITLANTFEGGTNGTTLTPLVGGNTGGGSGNYFDAITNVGGTIAFDSTRAAHGSLSMKIATTTASQTYAQWYASITGGPYGTLWFRAYLYFTANPTNQHKIFVWATTAANAASVFISTAGKIILADSNGTTQVTSTASIPLNSQFRLEGFCDGSATVGRLSFSMWTTSMDSAGAADETQTSTASLNTLGVLAKAIAGCQSSVASVGPYWTDDLAVSSTGPIGPAVTATTVTAGVAGATGVPAVPVDAVSVSMTIQGL